MVAHKLVGGGAQVVVVQLEPGAMVWCQPGAFLWKTPNVQVQTRVIGAGAGAGAGGGVGLLDRALATAVTAGMRRLAGQAAALPSFSVPDGGSGLVAFASRRPGAGAIRALRLEGGRGWLVASGALVAAEAGVGFALGERPAAGFERLGGRGTAFVCGRGSLLALDLARYGGSLDVDHARLVAVQDGVRVETPQARSDTPGAGAGALLTAVLGGGPLSVARLTGEGLALLEAAGAAAEAAAAAARPGAGAGAGGEGGAVDPPISILPPGGRRARRPAPWSRGERAPRMERVLHPEPDRDPEVQADPEPHEPEPHDEGEGGPNGVPR
ncbi:MAG TPA: AIM24 family protein [Actinomycetota bacterium]